jgi:hypothetical protein
MIDNNQAGLCHFCRHDKQNHEQVFHSDGFKTWRFNYPGCPCHEFEPVRKTLFRVKSPEEKDKAEKLP